MKKSISLTKQGREKLEAELKELIAERPAVAERIATARAFGDLSENEEYSSARAEQKQAENRILEIEEILKNAKTIKHAPHNKVGMGATVTLKLAGKEQVFTIVSPVEADPIGGKVSDQSPIGKALLGRQAGEEFTLPNGKTGQILQIA